MILKRIMDVYDEGIALAKSEPSRKALDAQSQDVDPRVRRVAAIAKKARLSSGNIAGSSFGKCSAQLQFMRHKDLSNPEYIRSRGIITFENGDATAAWLNDLVSTAYPNMSGLGEKVFYFPVPVTAEQEKKLKARINAKWESKDRLWGAVRPGFEPPFIRWNPDTNKIDLRMAADQMMGFVLDPKAHVLWAPTYVDKIVLEGGRPQVLENKALSSYQFRRAILGNLDYQKRAQLAGFREAIKLNVSLLGYRKDTGHLVEIFYGETVDATRVKILKSNGQEENFWVDKGKLTKRIIHQELGDAVETVEAELPPDKDWDVGEVWVPQDAQLLAEIRERILRVLLVDRPTAANPNPWFREYGPDFTCSTCQGTGIQTLAKTTKEPLKKGPKPCEDCEKHPLGKALGYHKEAALPQFPCGYCPVVLTCWKDANVRLEIADNKPTYIVEREAYVKAGLSFTTPPSVQPADTVVVPEEVA